MKRDDEERPEVLFGLHAVVEALESGKRSIDRVLVSRESGGHNLGRLLRAARAAGVPVTHLPKEVLAKKTGSRVVHQGVAALVAPVAYADPDEVCEAAARAPRGPLGCLGRHRGPQEFGRGDPDGRRGRGERHPPRDRRHGGGHPGGCKNGGRDPRADPDRSGAETRQPARGAQVEGVPRGGPRPAVNPALGRRALPGRVVLVAGGEAKGLRRGLLEVADARVALPLAPGVESLNVSVAVGAVLYEVVRQRGKPEKSEIPVGRLERP